ncbi:MAG: VOC family protein [Solirubrobacteraceae bacterium]
MSELDGHIRGLHHVTVGVDGAQDDVSFVRDLLGLRVIKATVLFDGERPVYHLYYGDRAGSAGSVFTTFPWRLHGLTGRKGSGQVKRTVFSAPPDAIDWWHERLAGACLPIEERFGQPALAFQHPSGLDMEIIGAEDAREPWLGDGVDDPDLALRGMHSVTLSVQDIETMTGFLELLGFRCADEDGRYRRLVVGDGAPGHVVDLLHEPNLAPGTWTHAQALHHHFALQVDTEPAQAAIKERLVGEGYVDVSEVKDRFYFSSIYVRSPAGVLIEFATRPTPDDPPGSVGWLRDETESELGTRLQLPPWWEDRREEFVSRLEPITLSPPVHAGATTR